MKSFWIQTWSQRQKFDDMRAERCSITFRFHLTVKESSFQWKRGMGCQWYLVWGFIFEEFQNSPTKSGIQGTFLTTFCDSLVYHFLLVDFLSVTALLRAYAGICGCRANICLNPRGECNQMHIRLCCSCISGATFLMENIYSVIFHWTFHYAYYSIVLVKFWVPLYM